METSRGMMSVVPEPTQEQHACMTFIVECIDSLDRLSMLDLLNEDFLDLLLAIALALDFLSTDENDKILQCSLMKAVGSSTSKTAQYLPHALEKAGNNQYCSLHPITTFSTRNLTHISFMHSSFICT